MFKKREILLPERLMGMMRLLIWECNGPPHPMRHVHTRTQQNRSAILFVFVVLFNVAPTGALGYLLCGVFYQNMSLPLGLNAPVLLSSNGLGNPTPTDTASLAHFQFSCLPVQMSPLWGFGLFVVWCVL